MRLDNWISTGHRLQLLLIIFMGAASAKELGMAMMEYLVFLSGVMDFNTWNRESHAKPQCGFGEFNNDRRPCERGSKISFAEVLLLIMRAGFITQPASPAAGKWQQPAHHSSSVTADFKQEFNNPTFGTEVPSYRSGYESIKSQVEIRKSH
ncbi:hypothetical protein D5086_021766 [Populus alba]|uniref:Uncharacterized protein n=1 Tax=Populus alba TaxID=43335 RepID=A0ACC4BET5_POPAL